MSGSTNFSWTKKFPSKKNSVYLATNGERGLVVKLYTRDGESKSRHEFNCLARARKLGIPVPEPMGIIENGIIMQYIAGTNLCDALNRDPREEYAAALAGWYSTWHAAFRRENGTLLRGDGILKNFIWNGELWGVDFEEVCPGDPAADIGKVCSSILNTDPMFTREKIDLCRILIERYERQSPFRIAAVIDMHIAAALNEAARWRPAGGELLQDMARQIAGDGLKDLPVT